jgi:hypothetical protein
MRGFEISKNTERPTWRPDTPLKANSNIGGAEIENQVEVDSNQILVDISTENTQYYLMHVRVYRNKAADLGVTSVGFHSELYTTTDSSVTTIDKATKIYSYSFFFGEVGYTEIPSNAELKSNLITEAVRRLDKEGVRYPERVAYNLFKEWDAIDFYTEFQTNPSLEQINLLGTSSAPIITSDFIPFSYKYLTCGYTGAVPTPPATNNIFLFLVSSKFSINSEAFPNGPTKSCIFSPFCKLSNFLVDAPTV